MFYYDSQLGETLPRATIAVSLIGLGAELIQ